MWVSNGCLQQTLHSFETETSLLNELTFTAAVDKNIGRGIGVQGVAGLRCSLSDYFRFEGCILSGTNGHTIGLSFFTSSFQLSLSARRKNSN
jgi:hypothetical protein